MRADGCLISLWATSQRPQQTSLHNIVGLLGMILLPGFRILGATISNMLIGWTIAAGLSSTHEKPLSELLRSLVEANPGAPEDEVLLGGVGNESVAAGGTSSHLTVKPATNTAIQIGTQNATILNISPYNTNPPGKSDQPLNPLVPVYLLYLSSSVCR